MVTSDPFQHRAHELLTQAFGSEAKFRPGQWEAIHDVAVAYRRVLVIQPTGWGKSLVYFLATRLLREQGFGPTVIISPLLSLMRNQVEMASKLGLRAFSLNSGNAHEWPQIKTEISAGACDILLISPERLYHEDFRQEVWPRIQPTLGCLVVDEVHCLADWGMTSAPITGVCSSLCKTCQPARLCWRPQLPRTRVC